MVLIRIGKIRSALAQQGLFFVASKIWIFFRSFFIRRAQILFIVGGTGDSARYRAFHHAQELRYQGISTAVNIQGAFLRRSVVDCARVIIFVRASYNANVQHIIASAPDKKQTILFDTDDLLFDKELFYHSDAYKNMNALERRQYKNGLGGDFISHRDVRAYTTTTTFLKEKIKEKTTKDVFVVRNKLSAQDCLWAGEAVHAQNVKKKSHLYKKMRIGYFSGSASHDRDFAIVENTLCELLEEHKDIELFIAGPLILTQSFARYASRIVRVPFTHRKKHFFHMASCDMIIAPLETEDPFCEAKSELKFVEAGIVHVPVVASATQTFAEAINDGIDGFTASDEQEWTKKLEQLIENPQLRSTMGNCAYKKSVKKYTTKNAQDNMYHKFLHSAIKKYDQ